MWRGRRAACRSSRCLYVCTPDDWLNLCRYVSGICRNYHTSVKDTLNSEHIIFRREAHHGIPCERLCRTSGAGLSHTGPWTAHQLYKPALAGRGYTLVSICENRSRHRNSGVIIGCHAVLGPHQGRQSDAAAVEKRLFVVARSSPRQFCRDSWGSPPAADDRHGTPSAAGAHPGILSR